METTIDVLQGLPAQEITINEVNGPDVTATNDFSHPDAVAVHTRTLTGDGGTLTLIIPAHSHQVMRLRLPRP